MTRHFLLAYLVMLGLANLADAGVALVREGYSDPLLGTSTGTTDNSISGHSPAVIQPAGAGAINVGSFYPEPRGAVVRFDLTDPVIGLLGPSLAQANLTLRTAATSATADQDMPVQLATLTATNSIWAEDQVNWQYQNSAAQTPWASGSNGPMTSGTDYRTPVVSRTVTAAEMNSTGTPVRFDLSPGHVQDWINAPGSNGGVFYWSTLQDNGGANLDDNFQVHSSQSGTTAHRPTLRLRYNTPFTRAIFDEADLSINNGDGYKNADNSNRTLTWGEAYVIRSYAEMYQATKDTFYLDKIIDHSDAVMANRDDFANFPYEVPGNNPIWTSGTDGEVSVPLTTGHILQGMVKFARLVNEDPVLSANPTYAAKATEYITRAQESIDYFNANYLETVSSPTRSYYAPTPASNSTDAINTDGVVGNLLLDMYHATGDAAHLTLAGELAQMIDTSAFYSTSGGNLAWSYKYFQGAIDAEDMSHGAQTAPFLAEMARSGQVISVFDAESIAKSVIEEAFQNGGTVTAGMDGSSGAALARAGPDPFNWSWGAAGGFIDMAQLDLRMIPVAEAVQLREYGAGSYASQNGGVSWPMLGIAKLVRYAKVPQELEASLSVDVGGVIYSTSGPVVGSLMVPNEVTLVNENDPSDVQSVTIDFGGNGNQLTELWQLSLDLDASTAPVLLGGQLDLDVTLLDGNGAVKNILGAASTPAGFTSTLSTGGDSLSFSGSLASSLDFRVNADEASPAGVARSWLTNASGDWGTTTNWGPFGVPDSTASSALFGGVLATSQTVYANTAYTVGSLQIDSAVSYVVGGAGSVNLQVDSGSASLQVTQGQHQFQVTLNLQSDTVADIASGAVLELRQGLHLLGNTLTKTGDGELAINGPLTTDGGIIDVQAGSVTGNFVVPGGLLNSGGLISPGSSPGTLEVVGDFQQTDGGTLLMELAGTRAGLTYDVLRVWGTADLGGTLQIALLEGFLPAAGDRFDLLDLGLIHGSFSSVELPGLSAGLGWNTSELSTSGTLSVTAVPEPNSLVMILLSAGSLCFFRNALSQSTFAGSSEA